MSMRSLFARSSPVWIAAALVMWPTTVRVPWSPIPVLADPPGPAGFLELDPCVGQGALAAIYDPRCRRIRRVFVDFERWDTPGRVGGAFLRYDFVEVTRPLIEEELPTESELSVAVRLVLSEVGADRLLDNQHGLDEAMGILWTVRNRLDPVAYDPLDRPNAPRYPGCEPGGDFVSCAPPSEYYGLATWRALDPLSRYDLERLEAATDLAVKAWYLVAQRYAHDPTDGATSYVHRCGGAAYGAPTWACDAHLGRPAGDVPGAEPHTGPIVFRAPVAFQDAAGRYVLGESAAIDYEPFEEPEIDLIAYAAPMVMGAIRW